MRVVFITSIFLFLAQIVVAQDGSDIRYVKPEALAASDIGKFVHLDFGHRSFALNGQTRTIDNVTLDLGGYSQAFFENRVDDGFNNWFKDQYLVTPHLLAGIRLRLVKHRLLAIAGERIRVESYFQWTDKDGAPVNGKSFTRKFSFSKKDLADVLIKVDE